MIKKFLKKFKKNRYAFFRVVIFLAATGAIGLFTLAYALFSETLEESGKIDVVISGTDIIITNVSEPIIHKNASVTSDASYFNNSVSFAVQLNQTNATVTYEITIKNNGNANARFIRTDEVSSNDDIIYTLVGIDHSTILAPEEELTFKIVISYSKDYKYSFPASKTDSTSLSFIFQQTLRNPIIPITGYIVEDSASVTETPWGAKATIILRNDNDFMVTATLSTIRSFTIYDSKGIERDYTIAANSEITRTIYIKDNDAAISAGTSTDVFVQASVTDYDTIKTTFVDSIELHLESKGKYEILAEGFTEIDSEEDFSQAETSAGGIYSTTGFNGKSTYFYRGIVKNNYFYFAGYMWRILRIDENGNIRLILNDILKDSNNNPLTNMFKTTNLASNLEEALTLVKFVNDVNDASVNSPIYGSIVDGIENDTENTLRGWYNKHILGTEYEPYIADSNYCMDIEGGTATSSGTNSSVYYFGPYQKIGSDTDMHEPSFDCPEGGNIVGKVGLLSVDEYVYAGGAFKVNNTSFFLNDSGISSNWWTLSPAYYDPSQTKVGVFFVDANGSTKDWPNANTITNRYGIRPVLSIKGTTILSGSGTELDPYMIDE